MLKSFKLTEQSLNTLKNSGVPENIVAKLEKLKTQKYNTEKEYIAALENEIGREHTVQYKSVILKYTTTTISIPEPDIKRETFVGRTNEMTVIEEAISDKGNLRVVNIHGEGGIGKTSILREVHKLYSDKKNLLITNIIDFFDVSTNTPRGFMDELIRKLSNSNLKFKDEIDTGFKAYRDARYKLDEIELVGITGKTLTDAQKEFFSSFEECYNNLSSRKRIIILIDTFEMVQFNPVEIMQSNMGEWLASELSHLKNTAVIIAGRENKNWQKDISNSIGKEAVSPIELKEFDFEDTRNLLNTIMQKLSDEELENLRILTNGLPILLILAVDPQWPAGLKGQQFNLIEKYTLNELETLEQEKLETIQEEFKIDLITNVLQLQDMGILARIVGLMALVYKYFTPEMLKHIEGGDFEEAKKSLDTIKNWAFIKYDNQTDSYWLHDVVRELVISNWWQLIDPTKKERKHICRKVVKFYDKLLEDIVNKKQEYRKIRKNAHTVGDKDEESSVSRVLVRLKGQRQHYQAHQVYYALIADFERGVTLYKELLVNNIWNRERYANRILHKERDLALKELDATYPEHEEQLKEARVEIVINSKYNNGLRILESILDKDHHKNDRKFYADILLYQGVAYNYKGNYEEAERKFKKGINILKELENKLESPTDPENLATRSIARTLSRSYGNLGYGFMMAGRFSESVDFLKKAIPYCITGKIEGARSAFLNDLAFVYARLGELERSISHWEKSFDIRQNLLFEYPIGLSYNNRGMIEYLYDRPYEGRKYSEKALHIFENPENQRGIGLANRTLGSLLSRIGQIESSETILKEAEKHLIKAETVFKSGGTAPEPIYLAETFEKIGLMYYHWYKILKDRHDKDDKIEPYFEKSKKYFEQCIKEYKTGGKYTLIPRMAAREKLAKLYCESDKLADADSELKKIEDVLAEEQDLDYFFTEQRKDSLEKIKIKRHELLYSLGKLEAGKARIAFLNYQSNKTDDLLKKSAKHYAIACAYLEHYSSEAFSRRATLSQVTSNLEQLSKSEKEQFKTYVELAQKDYKLESYSSAILKRIEDAIIIS